MSFEGPAESPPLLHRMSSQDRTDIRRVQGQISCAECRRLKLKCDKKIPCNSCVRRGFSSLCPTQSLTTTPATKRNDTVALRKKLQTIDEHVKQLENALSMLQATVSSEPHPLLVGHPRSSKIEPQSQGSSLMQSDMVDALGTLTLGKLGGARYLGRSAVSESLLEGSPEALRSRERDNFIPDNEIAHLVNSFPCALDSTWDVETSMKLIISYLPEKERAWVLADEFLKHNFWYIKTVTKEELYDELLIPTYQFLSTLNAWSEDWTFPLSPTRLAVLFICLAHGSLADLRMPMYSTESTLLFYVSRASLALHPVLVSPDLASIQALTLMASYYGTGGPDYSIEALWVYLTIAAKLAHSLGLHRESPRWGLDEKTIQRRRVIFWELYTYDVMISLDLGRPPSLFTAHVDTPLPSDEDDSLDDKGNLQDPGFHRWRMTFSKDVVTAVANFTLSPSMPDYQAILDLDRLVREHPLPQKYDPLRALSNTFEESSATVSNEHPGDDATSQALKGHHLTQFRAVVIMHIHRAFFAHALLQSPSDPLNSVYASSLLAAYRIASVLVHLNVRNFHKYSEHLSRYWEIWTGLLSAGITLGLIVARSPSCPIAANAYAELRLAVDLFEMGAPKSDKAKRALNVLLRMYDKATNSYLSMKFQENTENKGKEMKPMIAEDADALHTLETFAGYTRVLMKEMQSSRKESGLYHSPESDSSEASRRNPYKSDPESRSQTAPLEDLNTTHSGQRSTYVLPSSSTSPSSSSSSSSPYHSSSSVAARSTDYISPWQSPSTHAERNPFFEHAISSAPFHRLERSLSQSHVFDSPPAAGHELGMSGKTQAVPNRSSMRYIPQRRYSNWNDNRSQAPVQVPRGDLDHSLRQRMNEAQSWGPTGFVANNQPGNLYMMPVDAQWEELMRHEGVWGADT
ncbi:fungal-specific transcription factor domain-containing protein [Lentinula raphanica]|uniref:Fungal-specific transcription factor domain-containing protein n=1 Tax=Lentinula raphanica TaxID=153919 RepID=A0AA38UMG1_9AGAR|nr:fungal-specific transcription factor domain-containing protein [Lentinula raphanica]KAJ3975655.1 fungal-specific transcription factor domain-containing protein [Lentinula raphanica]